MFDPFIHAGLFLVEIVFHLYLLFLILRLILPIVGADYYNPISQMVFKVTEPLIKPLSGVLPSKNLHIPTALVLVCFAILKVMALSFFSGKGLLPILAIVVLAVMDIFSATIMLFFYAILAYVIISWISSGSYHPVIDIVHRLVGPLLAPIKRLVPLIGGLDLSPMILAIALMMLNIIVSEYLGVLARSLI